MGLVVRIGIIGCAGRQDDGKKIQPYHYTVAFNYVKKKITEEVSPAEHITLVSGGAAWMDHVAIGLFKDEQFCKDRKSLELHLPCKWDYDNHRYLQTGYKGTGDRANYLHQQFSLKMTNQSSVKATLQSIHEMLSNPSCTHFVYNGFHERNLGTGQVDWLIAFTFGDKSSVCPQGSDGWDNRELAGLKDGGTTHCWEHSSAPSKIHVSLNDITLLSEL